MKRAVSISLGSSKRDKAVEIELLGERVRIERIGTNMMEAALIAISGKKRRLTPEEINALLDQLNFKPQLQELN